MGGERRLHVRERRDDDTPDALGRVEREQAPVAFGQGPHHRRLALRPERRTGLGSALDGDELGDDPAPLHQEAVHRLVDPIDVLPEIAERSRRSRLAHRRLLHARRRRPPTAFRFGVGPCQATAGPTRLPFVDWGR